MTATSPRRRSSCGGTCRSRFVAAAPICALADITLGGTLGGGDSENHPVAIYGNSTGDYTITIEIDNENTITPTGADWDFQGRVLYA